MSKNNFQRGFSQILTVFLLVVGMGALLVVAQNPTDTTSSAKGSKQEVSKGKQARTVDLSAFQSPAPVPTNAVLSCLYSNPLVNNGEPQVNNNRSCPSGWTCEDKNRRTFSNYIYGTCTPPAGYNATQPISCSLSDNVIAGNGKVSNISCPWRWACVPYGNGSACAAPNGVNLSTSGGQAGTPCTPVAGSAQSGCPTGSLCVPSPTGATCVEVPQ
jgi:hypothetical protein